MCNKSAIEALKNQGSIVYNCSLVHKVYRKKGCDYRSNEEWSVYRTKLRFVFWAPSKATPFFDLPIVLNFGNFFFVWCCRKDSKALSKTLGIIRVILLFEEKYMSLSLMASGIMLQ
jgi:hypothetical protein